MAIDWTDEALNAALHTWWKSGRCERRDMRAALDAAIKAQGHVVMPYDTFCATMAGVRADALEEAATVVEKNMVFAPKHIGPDHGKHHEAGAQHAQRVFAAAIRELKGT